MKKILIIIAFIAVLYGCYTSKSVVHQKNAMDISGKWDMKLYTGGFTGGVHFPSNPIMLEFTADSLYRNYKNGQVVTQGTYQIRSLARTPQSNRDTVLIYSSNSAKQIFRIVKDTLLLADWGISDGYNYKYIRHK